MTQLLPHFSALFCIEVKFDGNKLNSLVELHRKRLISEAVVDHKACYVYRSCRRFSLFAHV